MKIYLTATDPSKIVSSKYKLDFSSFVQMLCKMGYKVEDTEEWRSFPSLESYYLYIDSFDKLMDIIKEAGRGREIIVSLPDEDVGFDLVVEFYNSWRE